ncbi:MAG TPA: Trp biosynthesis-associated membrane protein [Streptosporangiaceae bacterium]
MSSGTPSAARRLSPRWEYGLVLLAGAAGAGLVFLGMRQGWARVHTSAPRPLPGSNVTVTGQDLVPAASALAIAGLATLAAVIATRGLARRLAGGLLMLLGAGAAVAVLWPISEVTAIRAAASSAGRSGLPGSGTGAGSVTAGGSGGTGGTAPISGFLASVAMGGTAWRGLAVAGAALLVAAGLLTIWRSGPWPVMSSRYERPPRPAGPQSPVRAGTASGAPAREPGAGPPRTPAESASPRTGRPRPAAGLSSAAIWESLSRGEDPTSDPGP